MNPSLTNLLIAVLLLAANAFYVASEFALVKSKGFRIDALAKDDRFGAKLSQKLLVNLEAYLACCQLGITMASLGLGWVGEPTASAILLPLLQPLGWPDATIHFAAFVAGFLVFSSLHIVVGEQVPKMLAIRRPEPVSLWIAYPLHISYLAFYPLSRALNAASGAILRLLGVREISYADILSDVEIDTLVETSAEHGKLPVGQAEYIHNVFKFGELEVSDVMVHRTKMVAIDAALPPAEMVQMILESAYTRMPIYSGEADNIVGVVHAKDVLRGLFKVGGDVARLNILKLATKPWFVPETTPLQAQLSAFLRGKNHFALVVDEYGEVQGHITLEDILEEIVGDISDEHDEVIGGITKQADGSYLVDGALPIRDINRALDWELPDGEATTIAGLLIHETRTIPNEGQQFTVHNVRVRVMSKSNNRLVQLRMTPLKADLPG